MLKACGVEHLGSGKVAERLPTVDSMWGALGRLYRALNTVRSKDISASLFV